MAKSLRSKRKRMLRAIKRERYAVKELKRLKDMLGISDHPTDVEMKENLSQIATVVDGTKIHAEEQKNDIHVKVEPEESSDCQVLGEIVTLADASGKGDVVTVDNSQEDTFLGFLKLQSHEDSNQGVHIKVEPEESSDCQIVGEEVTLTDAASVGGVKGDNSNEDDILGGFLIIPPREEVKYDKNMKDQFGRYPPWFTRKHHEQLKEKNKLRKRKKLLIQKNNKIRNRRKLKKS